MTGPDSGWLLFGIGLYLAAILTVGFVTWRRNRSLDDFVLGGRRLSPFAAALSERASGESAWCSRSLWTDNTIPRNSFATTTFTTGEAIRTRI